MSKRRQRRLSMQHQWDKQQYLPGTDPLMGYARYKNTPFLFRDRPSRPCHRGTVDLVCADAVAALRNLSRPVNCWVTSPPYFRQIDYGVEGQYGLEDTVVDYLAPMMAVANAMRERSSDDANLFFNVRDSYNYTGGAGGDFIASDGAYRMKVPGRGPQEEDWPRKSFLGIPWRLVEAFEQVGWRPISSVIWDKKDARHGAADRMSYSYEHVLLFSASPTHYWDRAAVLEQYAESSLKQLDRPYEGLAEIDYDTRGQENPSEVKRRIIEKMKGRPGRYLFDIWRIHPGRQPRVQLKSGIEFRGIASFPMLLAEMCVLLGCPPGGLVGDPFCGFGTALRAAVKWGRNAWGNDLDPRSIEATQILLAQDEEEAR